MSQNLTVTKMFEWDCAHKLYNPKLSIDKNKSVFGLCNNIHGHTYKLEVTVEPIKSLNNGMVINFKDLKKIVKDKIVDVMDHSLTLTRGDIIIDMLEPLNLKINIVNYETTCENQINDFWNILKPIFIKHNISLVKLKLYETPTSYAELSK